MPCGPGSSRGRWGGAESLGGTGFPGRSGSPQHSAALWPDLALGRGGLQVWGAPACGRPRVQAPISCRSRGHSDGDTINSYLYSLLPPFSPGHSIPCPIPAPAGGEAAICTSRPCSPLGKSGGAGSRASVSWNAYSSHWVRVRAMGTEPPS